MSQRTIQVLREHKIIPDVLSEATNLSYDLKVKFPDATLDVPGKELGREETQHEPKLYLDPVIFKPQEKHKNYVLLLVDPDLMTDNDTNFGQVRHWFAANVSVSDDGEVVVYSAPQYNVSPYVGPAPLPNYMYHRPHRYIFILARSTSGSQVSVSAEDFQKLQEPYVAAFKGAQNDGVQDLKDRWGFNAQNFIEMRGLEVEAATFMLVSGTMKSAAANMLMSGQAMVNKALGR